MSPQIRIALIGGGLIGPRHASHVLANPDTALVAFVDPSPHAKQLAITWNVPLFTSVETLLSSQTTIDAAIVATPNKTHVPIATELVKAGVHVLVEKPVSTTIDDGLSLLRLLQEGSDVSNGNAREQRAAKVLVGHHRRFNPHVLAAKALLVSERLGNVSVISGLWCLRKPDEYFAVPTLWRRDVNAGGGPVLTNLIHDVDVLHFLLGPIKSVYAAETTKTRGHEVEEGVVCIFSFASGVIGSFVCSDNVSSPWNFESGTGENPNIPPSSQGFLKIMGSRGSVSIPDGVWIDNGGGWTEALVKEDLKIEGDGKPFDYQLEHFIRLIREEEESVRCSVEDGLRAMIVCDAVRRSVSEGKVVEIENVKIK